jgi:hypothetical protein
MLETAAMETNQEINDDEETIIDIYPVYEIERKKATREGS